MEMTQAQLAAMIDHTFLKAAGEADAVDRLCAEAREWKFACAMVNPCEVAHARRLLEGSGVPVGTVIDFPLGQGSLTATLMAAAAAVQEGAHDLDFVLNVRKLKYGDAASLQNDLNTLAHFCHAEKRVSKLILECCYLTDDEKVKACRLAQRAGFDFVKTSTGFAAGGATVEDVRLMRKAVGRKMGVKAAGGIRDRATALAMVAAGATRIGASAGKSLLA